MKHLIRTIEWVLHKWWLWLLLVISLCSCTTTRYVPVETVRTETVKEVELVQDSICIRDSIYIREKADTVFHTRIQWRHHTQVVRDTVRLVRCDTIPRVIEVEREFTRMEKLHLAVGRGAIWILGIAAIIVAIWFAKRLKGL